MSTYPAQPVTFVRGRGSELWDDRGQALPRLPVRPGRDQPRPRPPGGGRRPRRAGPHAAARLQPVRHRARSRGGGHPRPPAGRRRPGLLLQLGGRGQRGRHQAGPQVRAAAAATSSSAPTARSTAGPWPRCTPPASPRSTRSSSRCPRASATSPGTTSTPSRRRSTRRSPPCCSSPCRARAGSTRPTTEYFAGRPPALRRAGRAVHGRRDPDRPGPHRARGSASSTSASSPTWSPWPRPWATACPSAPAGPRPRWPRPSCPATTPPPSAASPWPPPRPARCSRSWSGRTCPPGPGTRASAWPTACSSLPQVTAVRGLGLLLAAELDGPRRPGGAPRPRSTPAWWSTASAPPPCASPPAC